MIAGGIQQRPDRPSPQKHVLIIPDDVKNPDNDVGKEIEAAFEAGK